MIRRIQMVMVRVMSVMMTLTGMVKLSIFPSLGYYEQLHWFN